MTAFRLTISDQNIAAEISAAIGNGTPAEVDELLHRAGPIADGDIGMSLQPWRILINRHGPDGAEVVRVLARHGFDPNRSGSMTEPAVLLAASVRGRVHDDGLVDALFDVGADPSARAVLSIPAYLSRTSSAIANVEQMVGATSAGMPWAPCRRHDRLLIAAWMWRVEMADDHSAPPMESVGIVPDWCLHWAGVHGDAPWTMRLLAALGARAQAAD